MLSFKRVSDFKDCFISVIMSLKDNADIGWTVVGHGKLAGILPSNLNLIKTGMCQHDCRYARRALSHAGRGGGYAPSIAPDGKQMVKSGQTSWR